MNKGAQLSLILVILISIVAATLLIYIGQPLPLLNRIITVPFLEDSPASVLSSTYETMTMLDAARYDFVFETTIMAAGAPIRIKNEAVYRGSVDSTPQGTAILQTEVELQALRFLIDAEVRLDSDVGYAQITELPAIPFVDLAAVDDQWYQFRIPTSSGQLAWLSDTTVVESAERLADQRIGGVPAYHYRISTSLAGMNTVLQNLVYSSATLPEMAYFDIWIGKKDHRLYAVELQVPDSGGPAMSLGISDFNIPVAVESPEKVLPVSEFATDIFSDTNILDLPLFGSLVGLEFGDDATDPDGDNLLNIWEYAFGSDTSKADTDGDTFFDGAEVRSGYSPTGTGRLFGDFE